MARYKKNLPLDEQLSKTIIEIESIEKCLEEMKQMKKDLENQIKIKRLNELDELIVSKGLNINDVKNLLLAQ